MLSQKKSIVHHLNCKNHKVHVAVNETLFTLLDLKRKICCLDFLRRQKKSDFSVLCLYLNYILELFMWKCTHVVQYVHINEKIWSVRSRVPEIRHCIAFHTLI